MGTTESESLALASDRTWLSWGAKRLGLSLRPQVDAKTQPDLGVIELAGPLGDAVITLDETDMPTAALTLGEAAWLEAKWVDLVQSGSATLPTPVALAWGDTVLAVGAEQERRSLAVTWSRESATLRLDLPPEEQGTVWIAGGEDLHDTLGRLAGGMMASIHMITPLRGALFGWMSWDELREGVTQEDVVANADLVAKRLGDEDAIVLLDDGWQRAAGDWEPNETFPQGMAWLTSEIHRRDLKAGLWIAPFMVALDSPLAQEHSEWLLRDDAGVLVAEDKPHWGGKCGVLDATQREVVEWLRQLADRIAGWGFDYVKFDFLTHAVAGRAADESGSRAVAYREAIRAIRQVLGPQVAAMGCGTPLVEGRGLFNAARVGDDVVTDWGLLRSRLGNMAIRHPLHRRWWWNDPDNVLLREPFTVEEGRLWATAVAISGGSVFLGDDLRRLDEARWSIAQRIWPPADVLSRPLRLGEPILDDSRPAGGTWLAEVRRHWGAWKVVAFLNWEDDSREFDVTWGEMGIAPETPCHVWEMWPGTHCGEATGIWRATLRGRSCRVFCITPVASYPQLIGCDRHVVVGAVGPFGVEWDPAAKVIRGRVEQALPGLPTHLVLALPQPWRPGEPTKAILDDVQRSGDHTLVTLRIEGVGRWSLKCKTAE